MEDKALALVRAEPQQLSRFAYEPANAKEAFQMAEWVIKSGAKPEYRNKEMAFLVLCKGRELGLSSMQALDSIDIIFGKTKINDRWVEVPKLCMAAQLQVALVQSKPDCRFMRCLEITDKQSTWETHRDGHPEPDRGTFTIEDARKLEYTGRRNWQRQPKVMLMWRAAAALCRRVYPDYIMGLYDPDEIRDHMPDRGEVVATIPASATEGKAGQRVEVGVGGPWDIDEPRDDLKLPSRAQVDAATRDVVVPADGAKPEPPANETVGHRRQRLKDRAKEIAAIIGNARAKELTQSMMRRSADDWQAIVAKLEAELMRLRSTQEPPANETTAAHENEKRIATFWELIDQLAWTDQEAVEHLKEHHAVARPDDLDPADLATVLDDIRAEIALQDDKERGGPLAAEDGPPDRGLYPDVGQGRDPGDRPDQ